jgi:hypothetical protein
VMGHESTRSEPTNLAGIVLSQSYVATPFYSYLFNDSLDPIFQHDQRIQKQAVEKSQLECMIITLF